MPPLDRLTGSRSAPSGGNGISEIRPAMVLIRCADSKAPRLSTRRKTAKSSGALIWAQVVLPDPWEKIRAPSGVMIVTAYPGIPGSAEFHVPFAGKLRRFLFIRFRLFSVPCGQDPGSTHMRICLRLFISFAVWPSYNVDFRIGP